MYLILLLFLSDYIDAEEAVYILEPVEVVGDSSVRKFSSSVSEQEIIESAFSSGKVEDALSGIPFVSFEGKDMQGSVPAVRGLSGYRTVVFMDGFKIFTDREIGGSLYFCPPGMVKGVDVVYSGVSSIAGSGFMGGAVIYRMKGYGSPSEISLSYGSSSSSGSFYGALSSDRYYVSVGTSAGGILRIPDTSHAGRFYSPGIIEFERASFRKYGGIFSMPLRGGEFRGIYCGVRDLKRAVFSRKFREYPLDDQVFLTYSRRDFYGGVHLYRWVSRKIYGDTTEARYSGKSFTIRKDFGNMAFYMEGRLNVNSRIYRNGEFIYDEIRNGWYVIPSVYYSQFREGYGYSIGISAYTDGHALKWAPSFSGYIFRSFMSISTDFSYRFPELVETRSYTPRTRGFIVGNPELKPEKSMSLNMIFDRESFRVVAFYQVILDFIDMVRLDTLAWNGDSIFTYVNGGPLNLYGLSLSVRGVRGSFRYGMDFSIIPLFSVFSTSRLEWKFSGLTLHVDVESVLYRKALRTVDVNRHGYIMLHVGARGLVRENYHLSILLYNLNNVVAYRSSDPSAVPLPARGIRVVVGRVF